MPPPVMPGAKTSSFLIWTMFIGTFFLVVSCSGFGGSASGIGGPAVASDDKNDMLIGAGSTFIYPLFSKLFSDYEKSTRVKVDYQSIGSGGGILQLTNNTIDFGDSDAPLNQEQTTRAGGPVLHIPVASGADVITYNLTGIVRPLRFTPEVLASIFLGHISNWNSPELASVNPGITLPDLPLLVIHRSDGSGTTFIFTDYLSKISREWQKRVGKATAVDWPTGLGGKGNEGVAGLLKQTPGAIGYIELSYAVQNKMQVAQIQNRSGKFITPNLTSITAASNIYLPPDARVSLVDSPNPDGYPLSSFSWTLIYKEQNYDHRSQKKARQLLDLLWWNIHTGQSACEKLHYARLSGAAVSVSENLLRSATFNGTPILH